LVVAVAVDEPPNVPLAPLLGAVNVTVTPLTGLPPPSFTVACSAVPNVLPTAALWGAPALATMLAGTAAVLVKSKLTEAGTPATLAVTL
jgi:hypothetical protein